MRKYVIAKYLRYSVDEAKANSTSIESQRIIIERYIASMVEPNIEMLEYMDDGYTGTNFERPGVQELIERVQSGAIDCVIVKDFSRFGRDSIETGYFLEHVFPLFHTRFIAISDAYDSKDYKEDTGGLSVAIKLLIYEQYSRDLSKKIKTAQHERKKRGEYQQPFFGYIKGKDGRLEIDEAAAETVRIIFSLAAEGEGINSIAKRLYDEKRPTPAEYRKMTKHIKRELGHEYQCLWEKASLKKILSDEQYTGTYVAGKTRILDVGSSKQIKNDESQWIKIPGHHPVIVDMSVFEKVQEIIGRKGEPLRKREIGTWQQYPDACNSPLKGKVVCGCCGHVMALSITKNAAFHCRHTIVAPEAECHRMKIVGSQLNDTLYQTIREKIQEITGSGNPNGLQAFDVHHSEWMQCEKKLEICEEEYKTIYECLISGEIDIEGYAVRKLELDAERCRIQAALAALTEKTNELRGRLEADQSYQSVARAAVNENTISKSLVDLLIKQVQIYPNHIEVIWKESGFGGRFTLSRC